MRAAILVVLFCLCGCVNVLTKFTDGVEGGRPPGAVPLPGREECDAHRVEEHACAGAS